jgi:putative two-component system response regulator
VTPRDARLLVVDDEEPIRRALARVLSEAGHDCRLAADAAEARARLDAEPVALMLCDVNLPGESGLELIRSVREDHPNTAIVMVSGDAATAVADRALRLGAYGYLIKPFKSNEVVITVANALERRRKDRDSHRRLQRSDEDLRRAREETIRRLSRALEFRDEETGDHVERMSRYCGVLAGRLGFDAETMRIASPMHDVGKIAVPDGILLKPGRLTPPEREVMQRHAEVGWNLLADSDSALLKTAATIARTHHEHYDGGGYPRGIAGEDIPIEGRIAAIADVFDALTSDRVYRPAVEVEVALAVLHEERGTHFDPEVLDAFLDVIDEVLEIRARYPGNVRRAVGATAPAI